MPSPGFAYDVFLSHSSKDKRIVREVAERLRVDGLCVWFDEWCIPPGGNIPHLIDEGLEQSAKLVLFMSANSMVSDWASVESQAFRFADPVNRELRFIPLRIDDTEPRASLRQFAYIDWRAVATSDAYTRLLTACRRQSTVTLPPSFLSENPTTANTLTGNRILEGHAQVNSVAITPDGRRAVSGLDDNTVCVWDLEGNKPPQILEGHTDQVWAVAITADGRRAISSSSDKTIRIWDLAGNELPRILEGHTANINTVAMTPDGKCAISGSDDHTMCIWDLEGNKPRRIFEGHTGYVWSVAISADGHRAISGAADNTVRVWDLEGNKPPRILKEHRHTVSAVAITANGHRAISASDDETVRIWDLEGNKPPRILKGHTDSIWSVAISADGRRAISGSHDNTVRVWDLEGNKPPRILEGHTEAVYAVAISRDGRRAISGSEDKTVRIWDLDTPAKNEVVYTNAKVLVVGESGAGKSGLTRRLAHDLPPPPDAESTSGHWATQALLRDLPIKAGWDRELWLWDFGGQADQRLIHQLFLDRAAAVLLMFSRDRESVLPGLREWQQALARSISSSVPVLLVAGRSDVDSRFDRERILKFAGESKYPYFETSALSGLGIEELRKALINAIPWQTLDRHESPARFKRLKDEITLIRDEGNVVLATFKELESLLLRRLPVEFSFTSDELKTVIGLLDGPGIVKELQFGTFILLQPEWINIYAQAVIRTLRAAEFGLGSMPVSDIRQGKLIFQPTLPDGKVGEERRLKPHEEQVVLQAMESVLLARRLCLQQDGDLVFPGYCGRERPVAPTPPPYFVAYTVSGFLDDIYATLVVKLAHCGNLTLKELWRDAADFETKARGKQAGIRLVRREDGRGDIFAYHLTGGNGDEQILFAGFIHDHLNTVSTGTVERERFYICSNCNRPVQDRALARELLDEKGKDAEIICQKCLSHISLWDDMEQKFAEVKIRRQIEDLSRRELVELTTRDLGKLLVHEVSARIVGTGQKCVEVPTDMDEGIDLEVEFTKDGRGIARRMYLQLKAGNSHLTRRASDGAEIFKIKKQAWVKYWVKSAANGPVMLVIGTLQKDDRRGRSSEKKQFEEIRWMEIGELLRRESENGTKAVKQIVFRGERLDYKSILGQRDKALQAQ